MCRSAMLPAWDKGRVEVSGMEQMADWSVWPGSLLVEVCLRENSL